jgi:hypothetical protein
MNIKICFLNLLIAVIALQLPAQEHRPEGLIRGTVTDAASGQILPGATVVILDSNPINGTTTDDRGNFLLDNLPVGRYAVQASLVGYEPAVFREIAVSSAKEMFLEISLKEQVNELGEVVVRPTVNKEAPLNRMATASARMLSVEEASRYAGGYDDPARLVTAFVGVAGSMNNNGIAIRGNSPQFLQWRMEGVEVPNPTHFTDITGVGGGILTALSSQMLGNSDFFTGAFPAEYGNALSGVFDMQMRSGNSQNHEHAVQAGVIGVEVASEGPFRKGGQASYLFNYRYSSMALADDLFPGAIGDAAGIRYQDISFKLNFPTRRAGTFSVWGDWSHRPFSAIRPERHGGMGKHLSLPELTVLEINKAESLTVLEISYSDLTSLNLNGCSFPCHVFLISRFFSNRASSWSLRSEHHAGTAKNFGGTSPAIRSTTISGRSFSITLVIKSIYSGTSKT